MQIRDMQTPGALVSALTRDLIATAAMRRQAIGIGEGERAAPGLAAARVELLELTERGRAGRPERITALGQRTAVRRVPAVLAGLGREDPRRRAVNAYAGAVEGLSAAAGATVSIEAEIRGSSAVVPDGGAAARAMRAGLVRAVHGVVNRWRWDRARRAYATGPARLVLAPRRGKARPISAVELLDAIAVEGLGMAEILRRHGWSAHAKHVKALTTAAEEILDLLAQEFGIGEARA
ncbi:hypothetical protein R5H32_16030 [Defluviimonas sp. D31]|uniref:hypothetical protein n=1 Tax=Defluviimonas sp. D31 TaxID=3083253 RepID=UPI00296F1D87|nr:hypothetical protein [Defluviimonas sp. D31]MDW4550871.1 hypothetical protein [Defluviimonas sp. D31]